jgi:hypothetical protein
MGYYKPIIVKSDYGQPYAQGFLPETQVERLQDLIYDTETANLQQEINNTLEILVKIHTGLVLLQAATDELKQMSKPGSPPENGFFVMAYTEEEVGDIKGKPIGKMPEKDIKGHYHDAKVAIEGAKPDKGSDLQNMVLEWVPKLEFLLPFLQANELPLSDFDPDTCRERCLESIQTGGIHEETGVYVAMALNVIELLWGANIQSKLKDVDTWMKELSNEPAGTEDWLRKKWQLDSFQVSIQKAYATGPNEAKLALGRIFALLYTNKNTFTYIFERLKPMEGTVAKFKTAQASDVQKRAWDEVIKATYGCLLWEIFQQVNRAVWLARLISRG